MMRIKSLFFVLICSMLVFVNGYAQEKKFSPEKFESDMEQYITRQANLTPQEAAKLFPLMRTMHEKQRSIYARMHKIGRNKPADEKECMEVIKEYDKANVELRNIEKDYHQLMIKELSASKVYDVIKAEARFHRQWMKRGGHKTRDKKR